MPDTMLSVRNLKGFYGESHILHDVAFDVEAGEVVTLIGRNGVGKTTTLKAIMGLLDRQEGSIRLNGQELTGLRPDRIARRGVGYVPDDRGIFASLTVEENLMLPPVVKPGALSVEEVYSLFPRLKERRKSQGTKLSGGEQQMLSIARVLRTGATMLLMDEPTEGLAPVIVQHIGSIIAELKRKGFTILLVEQNFHFASTVADRHYVMEEGRVVDMIPNDRLEAESEKLARYLGV